VAGFGDEDVVFNTHAEILFRNVDTGFHGDDHARLERGAVVAGVVDVQADVMSQAVNEIGAEGLAVEIFSMGIDVVVGNLWTFLSPLLQKSMPGFERSEGGVLRAENNFVDFALARRELAVWREWCA